MAKKQRIDTEQLKQAANGRWPEILNRVGGIPIESLDGNHHPCSRCGGVDRFRLIDESAGAVLCGQCFSAKNGDGIAAIQWAADIDFQEATRRIAEHLGIDVAAYKSNGKVARKKKKTLTKALTKTLSGSRGHQLWSHIGWQKNLASPKPRCWPLARSWQSIKA